MEIRAALATLFLLLAPAVLNATELKQETLTAWDAYMRGANLQVKERLDKNSPFDRHWGSGCPLTPATPPCVRVRTRRFEMVTLTLVLQGRKTERFEISGGKCDG